MYTPVRPNFMGVKTPAELDQLAANQTVMDAQFFRKYIKLSTYMGYHFTDKQVTRYDTLAANSMSPIIHDVWAAVRMSEGWKYGVEKVSEWKQTPWLKPYEYLPESVQKQDADTYLQVLEECHKAGWYITPSPDTEVRWYLEAQPDVLYSGDLVSNLVTMAMAGDTDLQTVYALLNNREKIYVGNLQSLLWHLYNEGVEL